MKYLKYLTFGLIGAFIGAFMMSFSVAVNSFDVPTVFGKVTCFKLNR